MSEKKRFRCETCDYVLEHDGQGKLPVCPKCGDEYSWAPLKSDESDNSESAKGTQETGFEQFIPRDITEGDASSMAIENMKDVPLEKVTPQHADLTEGEKQASTHPFDMPKETGFERMLDRDFSDRNRSGMAVDSLENQDGKEAKLDEYPFLMPKDTGFEQVTPTDFTEGDTSRSMIRSIIGPSDKEVDESHKSTHPFAMPKETGFERVLPTDFPQGDISSISIASIRPVRDNQAALPDVKRFRCAACGKLVEVTKDGKKFPPCPICGEQGEWTLVEPKR